MCNTQCDTGIYAFGRELELPWCSNSRSLCHRCCIGCWQILQSFHSPEPFGRMDKMSLHHYIIKRFFTTQTHASIHTLRNMQHAQQTQMTYTSYRCTRNAHTQRHSDANYSLCSEFMYACTCRVICVIQHLWLVRLFCHINNA